jgi:prepilin-type processing-associated H-X9-DG protein
VNSAREAGRRAQCQNNLRQITLGIMGYANKKNAFPPAGVFFEIPATAGQTTDTGAPNSVLAEACGTSAGVSAAAVNRAAYSWVLQILPDLDQQDVSNAWSMSLPYLWATSPDTTSPPNAILSKASIAVLRCPDDNSFTANEGNLSYVVNGGFTRFPAFPIPWVGFVADGVPNTAGPQSKTPLVWDLNGTAGNLTFDLAVGGRMGVMFLNSIYSNEYELLVNNVKNPPGAVLPQYNNTSPPWGGTKMTLGGLADGSSTTLLAGESTMVGYSTGSQWSGGFTTNWACPLPNFSMFIGAEAICGAAGASPSVSCIAQFQAGLTGGTYSNTSDNPTWAAANSATLGPYENINYGQNLTLKGTFPYITSGHPQGCNFAFCDGHVTFLSSTIDGTVYSKIITPQGSRLPVPYKQLPVNQDAFVQ